jgi:hypothetical protein
MCNYYQARKQVRQKTRPILEDQSPLQHSEATRQHGRRTTGPYQLIDDPRMIPELEHKMRVSIKLDTTHGMDNLQVQRVQRIENRRLWRNYQHRVDEFQDPIAIGGAARGIIDLCATRPNIKRWLDRPPKQSLPAGWTMEWAEADGRWFYWNRQTRESRWDSPLTSASAALEDEEESDDAPPGTRPRIGPGRVISASSNEFWLWHGTPAAKSGTLARHGFDNKVANDRGLYGAGCYFADSSSKSHQYNAAADATGHRCMFLCRVAMGAAHQTKTTHSGERRPPDNPVTPGAPYDSIVAEGGVANGGAQKHNEYVVFAENQVYPEYIIWYTVSVDV